MKLKNASFAVVIVLFVSAALSAHAQTFRAIYAFTGGADGADPVGGLISDSEGNGYGTTCCGGAYGAGTVFMLDKSGSETVLYSFTGGADGDQPFAGLIRDAEGNLYGTTFWGGIPTECNGGSGCGVVFKLDTNGNETVLHRFAGTGKDGQNPYDGLIQDAKGNLYGTTVYGGGSNACSGGCGVIFGVNPAGEEAVLHRFNGEADGVAPYAGLVRDTENNLYGTTQYGGTFGVGTVFKLDKNRKETVLYSFGAGTDGRQPLLGYLVRDNEGNLYGTTIFGGAYGEGTVFKLNSSLTETVLYSFKGGTDGSYPYAGLIRDAEGYLYGTTNQGGASGYGTVFKLDKTGKETLLHTFTGVGADGSFPYDDLLMDAKGNLYGTTYSGGSADCSGGVGCGIVFKLAP